MVVRRRKEGTTETVFSRKQGCVIKAQAPGWSQLEDKAIMYLQYAGLKFTKAWNQYLCHTFLGRTKSSTSGKLAY